MAKANHFLKIYTEEKQDIPGAKGLPSKYINTLEKLKGKKPQTN